MSDISYIRDTSGTTHPIKDPSKLPLEGGALTGRLTAAKGVNALVEGTGVAPSASGGNSFPEKWTYDTGVTPVSGDIFAIKVPIIGSGNGVYVSVDNGSHYYPLALNGTNKFSAQASVGETLLITLESYGSVSSIYPLNGGTSVVTYTGAIWRVLSSNVVDAVTHGKAPVIVTFSAINSLPASYIESTTVKLITSNMICVYSELSNPSVQTSDWTVTTYDGSVTVSGTINGSTSLTLVLMEVSNSLY